MPDPLDTATAGAPGLCDDDLPERRVCVRRFGVDLFPGAWWFPKRTVTFAWQVLHQAAAAAPQYRWVLDIGAGEFPLPSAVLTSSLSHFTVRGQGADRTRLRGSGDGHWQFAISACFGFRLEDLHLDTDTSSPMASCVSLVTVRCARVAGVRFQPIRFWGLRIGNAVQGQQIEDSSQVSVANCSFIDHRGDATTESLLAIGVNNLSVLDCTFSRIDGSAIGVGLWQDVSHASFLRCSFSGTGTGSYFGISVTDLEYRSCSFNTRKGVRGGLTSDLQQHDEVRAQGVTIAECSFRGPEYDITNASTEGVAVHLHSVDNVRIADCIFSGVRGNPLVIGAVYDLGQGPIEYAAPKSIEVEGCHFDCTRPVSWQLHADVLAQHVSQDLAMTISGCVFRVRTTETYEASVPMWQAVTLAVDANDAQAAIEAATALNVMVTSENGLFGQPTGLYVVQAVLWMEGAATHYTSLDSRERSGYHSCSD